MPSALVSGSILEQQIDLETLAVKDGCARYRRLARKAVERGEGASLKPAERMLIHWMKPLTTAIQAEKARCNDGATGQGRAVYAPVLMLLGAERAAFTTLREILSRLMKAGTALPLNQVAYAAGRAFIAEVHYDQIRKDQDSKKKLDKRVRHLTPEKVNWWARRTLDDHHWDRNVITKLGMWLVWNVAQVCSLNDYTEADDFRPAFKIWNRWVKRDRRVKMINLTRMADEIIEDGHALRQFLRPRYQPMLVQPMPWTSDTEGGYVRIRTPYITKPTPEQKARIKAAPTAKADAALNALGSVPWRINRQLHSIAIQLYESGGGLAGIPKTTDWPLPVAHPGDFLDPDLKAKWKAEAHGVHKNNEALRAERSQFGAKLAMADRFADKERFWYPHQFDFRYRAMPIPQPLNHHGDDFCRGMLEYAEPRDPGESGMRWLRVQMAGMCGYDKVSFADRERWVADNMEAIAGWAEAPLENTGWMETENPWQALACATALIDPVAACHLPFQTDGSCNALQHYAAIGRDDKAAHLVNLKPADAPHDVYMDVLAAVTARVEADTRSGVKFKHRNHEYALADIAGVILPLLNRKVVKQTAMTTMYDVTAVGAKRQVQGQLKAAGLVDDELYTASHYLSRVVLAEAGKTVDSAGRIMAWLRECARKVAKTGVLVVWTTPLEMPVVQPYRSWGVSQVRSTMGAARMPDRLSKAKVSVGRHRRGAAPNYIHSTDSTHMLMSATVAVEQDIHFAAVHDSFWCHAADADRTGRILREQFIELHELPLLEALHMEWTEAHPKAKIDAPPDPVGSYDLNEVLQAPYAFA